MNIADDVLRPSYFKALHSLSPWVLEPKFLYEQTPQKYSLENHDQIA